MADRFDDDLRSRLGHVCEQAIGVDQVVIVILEKLHAAFAVKSGHIQVEYRKRGVAGKSCYATVAFFLRVDEM